MRITRMRCNRIDSPLGFALDQPRLSWVLESERATKQLACQIKVALDPDFMEIAHDSGKREDIDSICYRLPFILKPRTRYYWRVKVWTDAGEVESPTAWFETAKMDEPWQAKWITPDWQDNESHPWLRKQFILVKPIKEARLYICGLGLYEVEINGRRVGDEYFTPYCNSYDNWIQYQTFDAAPYLSQGENAIGTLLGNGWYKGRFTYAKNKKEIYGDRFALICELRVTYRDSTTELICTDESWKAKASHILASSIYDGEIQDANRYLEGWSMPGLNDDDWDRVRTIDLDYSLLQPRRSLPVIIKETIKPAAIIHTPNGETVLDFGQNMVGWASFRIDAPQGTEVLLQYGEALQDGCFSQENLRSAKAEFTYISDGRPAQVKPCFTFYGFRYVKVEGWPDKLTLDDFTGHVIYSDLEQIGTIETSNPLVNRLFLNALWGQKGNFLDVPTDCPQRDERMGWTGDAQMFSGTACFNMDCGAFFSKFLYDLALEQKNLGGKVPDFVPTFGMNQRGSAAWSEAATVIPWNLYLHYGDRAILEQQLESMIAYIEFVKSHDDGDRLWKTGSHYGDWLALDGKGEFSREGGTPVDLIATAYYAYSAGLTAKTARVLGKEELAGEYEQLAEEVKKAFCEEFVTPRGRMAAGTQTAHILPLVMDLVPEQMRPRILASLVELLRENDYYLQTGFVGTPYLCRVLSENGYNDIAYRLLLNEEFPSWLYAVKLGATTIWERWNSLLPDGRFGELGVNSLNHYTYGSIVEWMYRHMCGINPLESHPGFRKIRLAPLPNPVLKFARAVLNSAAGRYESGWEYLDQGNRIGYNFVIPFNAEAELELSGAETDIMVNGRPLGETGLDYEQSDGKLVIILTTGTYVVEQELAASSR